MTRYRTFTLVLREALSSARSQPVASAVTMVIIAGMVAAILLTTGRTVGSERAVLSTFEQAGTRTIVIRAEPAAGIDMTVLRRLDTLDAIAWAAALGPAQDVRNFFVAGGPPMPVRTMSTTGPQLITGPVLSGTSSALDQLGLADGTGVVAASDGVPLDVNGEVRLPRELRFLGPTLLQSASSDLTSPVSLLVVLVDDSRAVRPLSQAVLPLLAPDDPSAVSISTSENLAAVQAVVSGQLGSFSRDLVILITGVTAFLVAAILYALVMMRRKDYGRRRALGATRSLVITLLVTQTACLGVAGAIGGTAVASVVLLVDGQAFPGLDFVCAVAVIAVAVAVVSAIAPATVAARRDPITELRVP